LPTENQPAELILSHEAAARIGQRLVDQLGPPARGPIIRDDAVMPFADKLGITIAAAREIYAAFWRVSNSS
jgi:hypothetical protein